jgi:hypothetical protein
MYLDTELGILDIVHGQNGFVFKFSLSYLVVESNGLISLLVALIFVGTRKSFS